MKVFKHILLLISLSTLSIFAMDGTDTDTEADTDTQLSDSENDNNSAIFLVKKSGWYKIVYSGLAINKNAQNEALSIQFYVNNKTEIDNKYTIEANSTRAIHDSILVPLEENEVVEFKFKAHPKVYFITHSIKEKLLKLKTKL